MRRGDLGLSSFQEDTERTQIHVLAVQAITSLVLSAMTVPVAGNPAVSCLEQQPRNKPLKALDTRWAQEPRLQARLRGSREAPGCPLLCCQGGLLAEADDLASRVRGRLRRR